MPKILENHYVLAVHDRKASADFYTRVLGFAVVFDDAGWSMVKRENCMIMLGECPDDMHPSKLGCHNYFAYLVVDHVDAYFAEVQAKDASCVSAVEIKPWGMREFGIKTIDGHRITVGQDMNAKPPEKP